MEDNMDDSGKLPEVYGRMQLSAGQPTRIMPTTLDEVWRFAQLIARSGLAPRDMQTPEKISVAIMHGLEVGLPPMQAMQRIAVINGRPCLWGDGIPALIERSGLLEVFDEWIENEPQPGEGFRDDCTAYCKVKRRGRTERISKFSVWDAKVAKLWGKKGGAQGDKDTPWITHPKRMLQMRARIILRDEFADVLGGLYMAEELIGTEPEMRDVTPAQNTSGAKPEQSGFAQNAGSPNINRTRDQDRGKIDQLVVPPVPPAVVSTAPAGGVAAAPGPSVERTQAPPSIAQINPTSSITGSGSGSPTTEDLDDPDPEAPSSPAKMAEWRQRLGSVSHNAAYDIFQQEIEPAHEAGHISDAQREELIEIVLRKDAAS